MDPLTAALNAYVATLTFIEKFWELATPEQKTQIIQNWLDAQKWWRDLFDKLKPGGTP